MYWPPLSGKATSEAGATVSTRIAKEDTVAPKEKLNPKIKQINDIISKFADDKKVFYKDIGEKFLNKEGGLDRKVMPDLLHLSTEGYQIWADAIKDDLQKLLK